MKTRFHIPTCIQENLNFKNKKLRSITGDELTFVQERIQKLLAEELPSITIAIPAYNEEANLFATLRSISLQQTNHVVEVLVVDNNSSDRTAELAEKCGARVISETKPGVAHARQTALAHARGEVLVSCDADTIYPPLWLDNMVKPITKGHKSVSYSLHCLYDETEVYSLSHYAYQYAKLTYTFLKAIKRGQQNCGGASMAFRTEQARHVGGYNTKLTRGEDGYLALQLSRFGRVFMVSSSEAFIYTSNRRVLSDGSMLNAFVIRAKHGFKHFFSFFSHQEIPTS